MSTDRELLELAAKAYWGDEIDDVCSVKWDEEEHAIAYTHADNQDHNGNDQTFLWNPLTDDGDALRLAVKCRLTVCTDGDATVSACEAFLPETGAFETQRVSECADKCAATRRAIVRAAAEIGRAMP